MTPKRLTNGMRVRFTLEGTIRGKRGSESFVLDNDETIQLYIGGGPCWLIKHMKDVEVVTIPEPTQPGNKVVAALKSEGDGSKRRLWVRIPGSTSKPWRDGIRIAGWTDLDSPEEIR